MEAPGPKRLSGACVREFSWARLGRRSRRAQWGGVLIAVSSRTSGPGIRGLPVADRYLKKTGAHLKKDHFEDGSVWPTVNRFHPPGASEALLRQALCCAFCFSLRAVRLADNLPWHSSPPCERVPVKCDVMIKGATLLLASTKVHFPSGLLKSPPSPEERGVGERPGPERPAWEIGSLPLTTMAVSHKDLGRRQGGGRNTCAIRCCAVRLSIVDGVCRPRARGYLFNQ